MSDVLNLCVYNSIYYPRLPSAYRKHFADVVKLELDS